MTDDQINTLVAQYVKDALERAERYRAGRRRPLNPDEIDDEAENISGWLADHKERLAAGDHRPVHGTADQLLADAGLSPSLEDYQIFARRLLIAQVKVLEIELKRANGDYSDEPLPVDAARSQPALPEPSATVAGGASSLGKVTDDYWKETSPTWKTSTIADYKRTREVFLDFIGVDTPIGTVDFARMRAYKQHLMDNTVGGSGRKVSSRTVNKYLTFAGAVFNYALHNGHITVNPVSGIRVKEGHRRPDEERQAFNDEDIALMFGSDSLWKATRRAKHSFFWITLLGLFTGARREEICQAYVSDFKTIDGNLVLDINEDAPDKSVKTSERRLVPLHPILVDEFQFPKYLMEQDPAGRAFPDLVQVKGMYGHPFGRWFAAWKTKLGIGEGKVFHSFRHYFTTNLLNAGVPEHVIASLVGHANASMTSGRYGKRFEPGKLLEEGVMKLELKVDFSSLIEVSRG